MAQVGDPLRAFDLASTLTDRLQANECVGQPLVLVVYLMDGNAEDAALLGGFRDLHDAFSAEGINVVGVGVESIDSHRDFAGQLGLRFPLLSDDRLSLVSALGIGQRSQSGEGFKLDLPRTTLFYDASLRLVRQWVLPSGPDHAREVLDAARAWLHREPPRDIVQHAPVLLIPNAIPADLCRRLIELWHTENEESGFMKQVEGRTVGVYDHAHKIRRDHFMKAGPLHDELSGHLAVRVIPEIFKAHNYRVTRREDFRIACYDAERGGYFRPHRDNTTDGTAHRRFAMSLLLNDDYEGGYLRFPEFGMHRYRPAAGGACIFSCSLLHEATDVTAGRRFVLLSFFYGEAEARHREEYSRRTGGGYRAGSPAQS